MATLMVALVLHKVLTSIVQSFWVVVVGAVIFAPTVNFSAAVVVVVVSE